jgi:glutamyl-tRNA reductase
MVEHCDVIVNTIDVPIITQTQLDQWKERIGPLLILDLAVPFQIPFLDISNHYIYRVDDLRRIAEENSRLRIQELEKAELIIREEVNSCWHSLQAFDVGELFGQVHARAEDFTSQEIHKLKAKLPHLTASDWDEIHKMATRLSSKVLQDPMVGLRSSLQESEEKETLVQFFRSIFRI